MKHKILMLAAKAAFVLVGLIYVIVGTMFVGKTAYDKTATLFANEAIPYVSEKKQKEDRLDGLTAQFLLENEAEYKALQYNAARTKAIETLEAELEKEKESLRAKELGLEAAQ